MLALAGILAVACAAGVGCNTTQNGVNPPADRVWYPSALMTDPAGPWLYVVNSNSDLAFNGGTIATLDLDAARADLTRGLLGDEAQGGFDLCPGPRQFPTGDSPPTCCRDTLDPTILDCDERRYVRADRTLRIGSFASDLVRGASPENGATGRIYLAVRADPSITVLDVFTGADGKPQLRCAKSKAAGVLTGEANDPLPACGESDRVMENNPAWNDSNSPDYDLYRQLPAEPYGLALDEKRHLLYAAHLTGGAMSLMDTCYGGFPQLLDVNKSLLPAATNRGFTSVVLGPEDDPLTQGLVFATSRFTPAVVTARATSANTCLPYEQVLGSSRDAPLQGTSRTIATGMQSGDVRGIIFSPDPPASRLAYVLQRTGSSSVGFSSGPPAVVFIDIAPDANGVPKDTPVAAVQVCAGATGMTSWAPGGDRSRELLFITCYEAGSIAVVDPRSRALRAMIDAGRGPSALTFDDRGFGYVAGFGANDIAVLDVREASATRFRIIQRLGYPTTSPRK